jgi:hypothetical protein
MGEERLLKPPFSNRLSRREFLELGAAGLAVVTVGLERSRSAEAQLDDSLNGSFEKPNWLSLKVDRSTRPPRIVFERPLGWEKRADVSPDYSTYNYRVPGEASDGLSSVVAKMALVDDSLGRRVVLGNWNRQIRAVDDSRGVKFGFMAQIEQYVASNIQPSISVWFLDREGALLGSYVYNGPAPAADRMWVPYSYEVPVGQMFQGTAAIRAYLFPAGGPKSPGANPGVLGRAVFDQFSYESLP